MKELLKPPATSPTSFDASGWRRRLSLIVSICLTCLGLIGICLVFAAQTRAQESNTDSRYRIGPGDVLEIRVLRAPELSRDAVRVDQSGMIRMPMWNDDVRAACLTEGELAQHIAKLYLKYKRDPHVDVFVKEFQSQPVAVTGAVHAASNFKLQRQVRLLELLSFAGEPPTMPDKPCRLCTRAELLPVTKKMAEALATSIAW